MIDTLCTTGDNSCLSPQLWCFICLYCVFCIVFDDIPFTGFYINK